MILIGQTKENYIVDVISFDLEISKDGQFLNCMLDGNMEIIVSLDSELYVHMQLNFNECSKKFMKSDTENFICDFWLN